MTSKKKIRISVPATTANMGPGFDTLGAALKLYNRLDVHVLPSSGSCAVHIDVEGEGKDSLPRGKSNIVWKAMEKVFSLHPNSAASKKLLNGCYRIELSNGIPLVSGLGSSAAARLAGVLAANEIAGRILDDDGIVALGTELEGHPDNIVPAFAGGFCVSICADNKVQYVKLDAPRLKAVVCNPGFELSTEAARRVLPRRVPMSTAVFNVSRVAFLMAVLQEKRYNLLGEAMQDRLHQPAREHLVPGMSAVMSAAMDAGASGVALSGAGPSLIAFVPAAVAGRVAEAMRKKWRQHHIESRSFVLDFDRAGARIVK